MLDLKPVYQQSISDLKARSIETPELAARMLMKSVLDCDDMDFITGTTRVISPSDAQLIQSYINRHISGEPVTKIIGRTEFWGLPFIVNEHVLDPRPDTETLIEAVLKAYEGRAAPGRILDLGTGSGCIPIALLSEFKEAEAVAVDVSAEALDVARQNAAFNNVQNRVDFRQGSWCEALKDGESFDLIVSNPPYIPAADIANLDDNVRNHDPILALEGGNDGLDCYRIILEQIKNVFSEKTLCFFEVGISQADDVARLAIKAGLSVNCTHTDLAGIPRVVDMSFGDK